MAACARPQAPEAPAPEPFRGSDAAPAASARQAPESHAGSFLGVLEDTPASSPGEPRRFVVRAVFYKGDYAWRSFDADCSGRECLIDGTRRIPPHTDWTISLRGRRLRALSADAPNAWRAYSAVGTQHLAPGSQAPTSGARSMQFAGWAGEPVFRPLVATSPASFQDPEAWRPTTLPPASARALRRAFHARFSQASNCENPYKNIAKPFHYGDDEIAISDPYASSKGWALATLALDDYRCDGFPSEDEPFMPHVFVVSPAGAARELGAGLHLVDAGDFDGDASSELLFAIDRYNRGGYELHYSEFSQRAVFDYSYH